jgi:hypothetical protein
MDRSVPLAKTLQEVGSMLTFPVGLEEVLDKILDSLGHVVSATAPRSYRLMDRVAESGGGRGSKT